MCFSKTFGESVRGESLKEAEGTQATRPSLSVSYQGDPYGYGLYMIHFNCL